MILSKSILFFCFYLLLLDNSLGEQTILKQGENKKLFKDAIKYGKTYGGLLGELGSYWKQLLIQLVQANRKLELGKVQLARFNDSATTEDVGLAITDSYADRVAELVAIRAQDIGATQKYIDDLEILKNEIALTMIVEMDETKEQFKEKNVRKKVKEAKENGITDTDIKVILFAEFFDTEGGLSLIGARASIADRLLSSFLNGLKSILYKTYYEKLGIIEYGKGDPKKQIDHPLAESDGDSIEYVVPGSSGGATGGGASGDSGGSGGSGGPPGGPSTDPPTGPPSVVDVPDDSQEEDEEEDDKKKVKNPDKDLADFFQANYEGIDLERAGGDLFVLQDRPFENREYSAAEIAEADKIVKMHIDPIRRDLDMFERNVSLLQEDRRTAFRTDPLLQAPDNLSEEGRLALSHRRIEHFQGLEDRTREFMHRYLATYTWFRPRLVLTQRNYEFYAILRTRGNNLPPQPEDLEEFNDLNNVTDRMRFLISFKEKPELEEFADRYITIHGIIERIWEAVRAIIKLEQENIKFHNNKRPATA